MRDDRRGGAGAGRWPHPPPPGPPGSWVLTTRASRTAPDDRPADPAAPDSPNTPEVTRTGHHGWPRFPALRAPPPSTIPRITPGKRVQAPLNNLPGEEDSSKQTITATFTLHASKTTPEQPFATPGEKGSAHVMRAQRNRIHPGSRDASPARHNPPRLDSREPASHNAR